MKLIIDIPDYQYEYIKQSDKNIFADVSSKECMLHAIKMGTPVSTDGDLISRKALREKVNAFYDSHFKGLVPNELITYAEAVDNAIDSAPIVNFDKTSFIEGFKAGCEEGKKCYEKPQGEWICTFHSSFPQYESSEYRCSICNGVGGKFDKFCNNCGAQMKGELE